MGRGKEANRPLRRSHVLVNPEPKFLLHLLPLPVIAGIERWGGWVLYDLDNGIYYPAHPIWVKALNRAWGTKYKPEDNTRYDFKALLPPSGKPSAEEVLASVFRDPNHYLQMKPREGIAEVTQRLHEEDRVVQGVVTSRPAEVREATVEQLRQDKIHVDFVILSRDKVPYVEVSRCKVTFEDNPQMVMAFYQVPNVLSVSFGDVPYVRELDEMYTSYLLGRKPRRREKFEEYPYKISHAGEILKIVRVLSSVVKDARRPLR